MRNNNNINGQTGIGAGVLVRRYKAGLHVHTLAFAHLICTFEYYDKKQYRSVSLVRTHVTFISFPAQVLIINAADACDRY